MLPGQGRLPATTLGTRKLEILGYLMAKTASLCVFSFWHNTGVWRTDRQTEKQRQWYRRVKWYWQQMLTLTSSGHVIVNDCFAQLQHRAHSDVSTQHCVRQAQNHCTLRRYLWLVWTDRYGTAQARLTDAHWQARLCQELCWMHSAGVSSRERSVVYQRPRDICLCS